MYQIDLKVPGALTPDKVAELIASKDDSANRQLRVTVDGIAYLSDEVGATNVNGLAFRLETWSAGSDYVGQKASQDVNFVQRIYICLKSNWPKPADTYIDLY